MRRLLMLMILAGGAVGQDPAALFTNKNPNGLWWLRMNSTEKAIVISGVEAGFNEAKFEASLLGQRGDCLVDSYRDRVVKAKKTTNADLAREIDAFYNVGANVSLPWTAAFLYSEMKLAGATKAELDVARKVSIELLLK